MFKEKLIDSHGNISLTRCDYFDEEGNVVDQIYIIKNGEYTFSTSSHGEARAEFDNQIKLEQESNAPETQNDSVSPAQRLF